MPTLSSSTRIAIVYGASFLSFGIYLPFFPLLLAARGLDETEIAIVVAAPMVLRVATASLLGAIADRAGDRRPVLVFYCAAALATFAALPLATGFLSILAVVLATALTWNGVNPLNDAIAGTIARREGRDYGRMRVWGSISFIAANLVGGFILARTRPETVYPMLVAAFALQFAASFLVPRLPPAVTVVPGTAPEPLTAGLGRLITDRSLVGMLVGASLMQASHAMLYGFGSLHWRGQGYGDDWVGLYWAIGVVAEVTLFLFGRPLTGRLGARGLFALGGFAGVLRWATFPFIADPIVWSVLQLTHALSFAATHLGVIQGLARAVPERHAATAQGLYVAISGLAMALTTLASGPIYKSFGANGFYAMAIVSAVGAVVALLALAPRATRAGEAGAPGR